MTAKARRRQRATLYVRLSNAADEKNLSRDGMAEDLVALAGQLEADVYAIHIDDGISGSVRDRPEFLAWLADARDGHAEIMLAWSGDRLTREGINAAAMVLDCVEGKDSRTGKVVRPPVRFVSFDDRLDSEDGDGFRWRFVIAAEVARGERERAVKRNTATRRRMLAQGRHVGAVPYGYRVDPERPAVLVIDPAEEAVVKDMARRAMDGIAPGQIARSLNAAGILPGQNARGWTRTTVVQVITNPANAGEPLRPGVAGRPPILPYSTVAELRRRFAPAPVPDAPKRTRGSQAMLAGLLLCHTCLRPMRSTSGRYVCMTAADGGICSGAVSITRRLAEEAVAATYVTRWGRLPEVRQEVIAGDATERDAIEREHAQIMSRLATAPDAADFARLQELAARRAELDAAPAMREVRQILTGRTWAEAWQAATPEDRRDMLLWAYDAIICHPHAAGLTPAGRLTYEERPEVAELALDEFGDIS